jgi:hypothetical protein
MAHPENEPHPSHQDRNEKEDKIERCQRDGKEAPDRIARGIVQ